MKTLFHFNFSRAVLFFPICFLLFSVNVNSQNLDWQWAKSVSGGLSYGKNCAADAYGNIYLTGQFTGHHYYIGSVILTNTVWNGNTSDFFLIKYDNAGTVLWAKSAGGTGDEVAKSIAKDQHGHIYVTGTFKGPTAVFGNFTLTNSDTSGTTDDIFIAEYNSSGDVMWAKSAGGTTDDEVNCIDTDTNGDIFITGYFKSILFTIGNLSLANANVSGTSSDIFVGKFDTGGNLILARRIGGAYTDYANSIASDAAGNFFLTGHFGGYSVTFGNVSANNSYGAGGFFIVKFNSLGNSVWSDCYGGDDGSVGGSGVAVDDAGNAFVTGWFYDDGITLGIPYNPIALWNSGTFITSTKDIFIAKYNGQLGNIQWLKGIRGGLNDIGSSITLDPNGNLFITGYFYSTEINFGNDSIPFPFINPYGSSEFFIAAYNTYGNEYWAKTISGIGHDSNTGMSTTSDPNGNIYVTGSYGYPVSFGFINLPGYGNFLAKLSTVTGVEESNPENTTSVFPNPFTESTTIQFSDYLNNAELNLYNLSGQKIKTISTISGNEIKIDREDLPAGIYFAIISKDEKIISTAKLVITD